MAEFNIGDIVYRNDKSIPYTVIDVDKVSKPMPIYKLAQDDFSFWDYCICWKRFVSSYEARNCGEILTSDCCYKFNFDDAKEDFVEIYTIKYEDRIFYYRAINGKVEKFKELTAFITCAIGFNLLEIAQADTLWYLIFLFGSFFRYCAQCMQQSPSN